MVYGGDGLSTPREPWWGYVRNVLYSYPALKQREKEGMLLGLTASINGMPRAREVPKPVEQAVILQLSDKEQERIEAVERAIHETSRRPLGQQRLKVIDMVFFRQSHTLNGAADAVHVSYWTAGNWQREFIRRVAKRLSLL